MLQIDDDPSGAARAMFRDQSLDMFKRRIIDS